MTASTLADACENHHPGDVPAVFPHTVADDAGSLRAEYRCPCGRAWMTWWDPRAAGWPGKRVEREAA